MKHTDEEIYAFQVSKRVVFQVKFIDPFIAEPEGDRVIRMYVGKINKKKTDFCHLNLRPAQTLKEGDFFDFYGKYSAYEGRWSVEDDVLDDFFRDLDVLCQKHNSLHLTVTPPEIWSNDYENSEERQRTNFNFGSLVKLSEI